MENILTNSGLIHIREQIFSHFDLPTLKNCREVFAKRFGEVWDLWLEKLILIQWIHEFGETRFRNIIKRDFVPGWDKAVKKFSKMASLNNLNEIKESMEEILNVPCFPSAVYELHHFAARKGHVKLMELLFFTDLDINEVEEDSWHSWMVKTPFFEACYYGQTEIVNLMVTSSKKYGIDLNAGDEIGWTGFMIACCMGGTEIVKLMIENRTKYGINIQQEDDDGNNALDIVKEEIKCATRDEEEKASLEEVKHILEKAYLEDNEPQPTV